MKRINLILLHFITACVFLTGCTSKLNDGRKEIEPPITIVSPSPIEIVSALSLNEDQKKYVANGSEFALRCLQTMYNDDKGKNLIFSPLSLQYALAMAANGASGNTQKEIVDALGFDGDMQSINSYMNILLEQLPALDDEVEIKVTDAVLVSEKYKVLKSFQDIMNNGYYAPVEYVDLSDKLLTVSRVNEWASRNTNGIINPFIDASDIDDDLLALILNALYFKSKWHGNMFIPESTQHSKPFYCANGQQVNVDYLSTVGYLRYVKKDGYQVVELPYSKGKFAMYVLLPDSKSEEDLTGTMSRLSQGEWKGLIKSMAYVPEVYLKLPKFEATGKYNLKDYLKVLGIEKAFVSGEAEFDQMFTDNILGETVYINNILQKARIKVTEWGTEAAAVTMNQLIGSNGPVEDIEEVYFTADHPFIYIIAEQEQGVILFAGVYAGVE